MGRGTHEKGTTDTNGTKETIGNEQKDSN